MCTKRVKLTKYYLGFFLEDTLWTGIPGNYTNPNAPEALSEVRKLVDNGQYAEATTAAVKLSDNPSDVCIFILRNIFCFILLLNKYYPAIYVGL